MLSSVRRSEMSANPNIDAVGLDKKISRVLRLRDMFQTGIIRPIEEIDDPATPPMPTSDKQISDERLRFLRTLPGSPPLSTLRAHQANFAKTQTTGTKNLNKDPSLPNGTGPIAPSRPSTLAPDPSSPLPPATPPKPSYLPLDILPPANRPTAFFKSKVSSELQKSIAIFESGNTSQPATQNGPAKPVRVTSKPPGKTKGTLEARRNVFQPSTRTDTLQTSAQPQQRRGLSSAQRESSFTISIPPRQSVPETNAHTTVVPNRNGSSQPALSLQIPPTGFPCGGSTPKSSPLSAGVSDSDQNETEYESVESYKPGLSLAGPGRLSSWQGTSELNRISPSVPGSESVQDFIVQSNAFRTSPNYMLEAAHLDHAMPTLQHAETIAVTTPDEDDDSDGVLERPTCPVPNLPVPASLKVVAVDPEGVHILEDGNFVYAVPGLPGHMDSSSDESNVVQMRSCKVPNRSNDAAGKHSQKSSPEGNGSLLPDSSHDSLSKRVRFSGDPILIFSTYSTSEYDRRNDEVDPLAASAEYELEKHLEEMDLFNVDLQKSAQGLGISILGLGVDNVGGEQKLGIFIKALTPGGAAEANGKIMVYDQIVEVDGISLVGVSQQFAAQTLRSTKDVVHFVLAREKDPANSRIAQLLAEQEQDEVERAPNPVERSPNQREEPKVQEERLPRDDSLEALHKMLAEAQNAFRHSETPLSDDEVTDLSAVGPDTSLRETEHSADAFPQTVGTSSPATDLDRSGLSDSPGPRSALKGTATAASTKRRQDALQQLIRSAEERAQSESGEVSLPPLIPGVDKLTWILANDLYDCHAQLLKTQSQLQLLEQRLATQEAAAEEAIERLCLQCRHVELRLNETHSRLNEYVQAHQEGRLLFTDITASPQTASNGHSPNVTSPCKTVSKADNADPSLPPNDLTLKAAAGPGHSKPELGGVEDAGDQDTQDHTPQAAPADVTTSATTDEVATWSQKQVQDRARLISSGGLSNRRPRTRVVINPPPTLPTEPSVSTASSSSDVTYVQSVTQHLLFPVPTGGQSASPVASPATPSKVEVDVRGAAGDIPSMMDDSSKSPDTAPSSATRTPGLNDSSHSSPAVSSTMGTPDSAASRISSHKAMGIQLPGLSPGMLQGIHLRRRSPTPDQPPKDDPGSKP